MTDNILQVRGLKKTYGGEKKKGIKGLTPKLDVLRGIDIDIQRGDVICLIGPSGCGKSTFLRCLNRLEIPTEGTVTFEGEEVNDKDIDRIRRKMGMVFQHFNLFPHMTVKQNLCMAPVLLKLKTQEEAEKRADELLARVGLSEKANVYPNSLSGGQKQRIAIARALTMVVVTHEMGFAREVASRVIFIDEGKIQEDEPPQEFFTNPKHPRLKAFLSKLL